MNSRTKAMIRRVARRILAGIPIGRTWEQGTLRIHRYRESFLVTDLTNAGKRGKKCREMSISLPYSAKDPEAWLERMSDNLLEYQSYDGIKAFIQDLLVDYPKEINLSEREVRGIDTKPIGPPQIRLKTNAGLEIEADSSEFRVLSKVYFPDEPGKVKGRFDTYGYYSKDKKGAALFYNWLAANLSAANNMSIQDLQKLWRQEGIAFDSHSLDN